MQRAARPTPRNLRCPTRVGHCEKRLALCLQSRQKPGAGDPNNSIAQARSHVASDRLSKDYEAPSLSRFGNTLPFLFRCKKCRHLRTRTVCVLLLFLAVTRDDLAFRIRVRVQHRRSPHSSNRKTSLSLLAARAVDLRFGGAEGGGRVLFLSETRGER